MIRILFLLFFVILLDAKNIEIFGSSSFNDTNISKVNNAIFIRDNIFLSADEVIYYKNEKYIISKGRVYITYSDNSFILSTLSKLNLTTKDVEFYPFFIFDSITDVWLSSVSAKKKSVKYSLKNILSSSCSVKNPDWKIVSSSGDYNKKSKWVNLYNPTFYIHNVPVLYLPYLGFSNDNSRKQGFLRPLFGYSENEGFLYSQPYYIPFSKSKDLEIIPSIRTFRGKGIYSNYRFVDSNSSYGNLKVGYFEDNKNYRDKYNLKNYVHNGFKFEYLNNKFLTEKDDLYIDLNYANDTDFFYLDSTNNSFIQGYLTDKIVTSNINWIYQNNKNYYGIYSKYFIDTSKLDNSDTFQILPEFQYHRFTETLFFKKLTTNIDFNAKNYYRKTGDNYLKKSFSIPLRYNFSFFDDYFKFDFSENFYGATLYNYNSKIDEVKQFSLYSIFDLYTNLSKEISENLYHNIRIDSSFFVKHKNYIQGKNSLMESTDVENSVTLKLNQYLTAEKWNINHKISQTIYKDNSKSNIFNELNINYYRYFLLDNNEYSEILNRVYYNSFTFGYNNELFNMIWSHIYKYKVSRSYKLQAGINFSAHHQLYGSYNYDYEKKDITKWNLGIKMSKKCWNYNLKFSQEKIPILTNDGVSNINQNTIYFGIEFNPIGGFEQTYTYKDEK